MRALVCRDTKIGPELATPCTTKSPSVPDGSSRIVSIKSPLIAKAAALQGPSSRRRAQVVHR